MLKDTVKNINKVGKMVINGYLERDYSYLAKPEYVKSENEKPRLNLVISSIDKGKMYGGLTTAVNLYFYLCKVLKWDMRIIVTENPVTEEVLGQYSGFVLESSDRDSGVHRSVCNLQAADGKRGKLAVRGRDIMMTTYWSTHYMIAGIVQYQKETFGTDTKLIYLIQDFEPGFYPWSTEYMLCESTYKTGNTVAVFNSGNLKNYVEKQGYTFEYMIKFEPRLNKTLLDYMEKTRDVKKKKQMIIYGRPKVNRNCFAIIVEALKLFANRYEGAAEWEFLSLGGKHRDVKLGNGCVLKACGKLTLEEYAKVLASSSVGISLMCSPHPSYPPLEMAAYGVKTITNSFVCKDLSGFSSNIISLDVVNFDTVAAAVEKAAADVASSRPMTGEDVYLQLGNQFDEVGKVIKEIFTAI